jgi:hypothetical protein
MCCADAWQCCSAFDALVHTVSSRMPDMSAPLHAEGCAKGSTLAVCLPVRPMKAASKVTIVQLDLERLHHHLQLGVLGRLTCTWVLNGSPACSRGLHSTAAHGL